MIKKSFWDRYLYEHMVNFETVDIVYRCSNTEGHDETLEIK